jgi:polyhydroxyalkanoic acid synthase PhaR subunit
MSESNNEGKSFDPFEAWRGVRNVGMEAWAKAMTEAVNSEEYAKTSGTMLDAYLTASIPLRDMLEKAMAQALQQMNMPTRDDFISLAERLIQVEMRLDDMDAKLDAIPKRAAEPPPVKAPATKRPAVKSIRKEAKKK